MRRLNVKKRGRSASIAVPGTSCNGHATAEEDDIDEEREEGSGNATDKPSRTMLSRTNSARRYQQPSGCEWTAADLQDISADSWRSYYLRCFSVTSKRVVSRGDRVRYRRVRGSPEEDPDAVAEEAFLETEEFVVYLMGASGVGKTAITQQFTTSEHILNAKSKDTMNEETTVTISLDGEESRLVFKEINSDSCLEASSMGESSIPAAILVVYSVTQEESFCSARRILCQLHRSKLDEESVLILVGNKSDLVRSRSVDSEEGLSLATSYKIKFIETSVGINYNVDELLVGVLTHLRALNKRRNDSHRQLNKRNRFSGARSSIRRIIRRVLKKDEPQTSNCDILKVS